MNIERKIELVFESAQNAELAFSEEPEDSNIDEPVIYWNEKNQSASWFWGGDVAIESETAEMPWWGLGELMLAGPVEADLIKTRLG